MSDYSYFCEIDLAKSHFSIPAVDQHGKTLLHKSVTRSKLLTTIANMLPMQTGNKEYGGTIIRQEHYSNLRIMADSGETVIRDLQYVFVVSNA